MPASLSSSTFSNTASSNSTPGFQFSGVRRQHRGTEGEVTLVRSNKLPRHRSSSTSSFSSSSSSPSAPALVGGLRSGVLPQAQPMMQQQHPAMHAGVMESAELGMSSVPAPRHRDPKSAPLYKLSVDLINTYKHINEVHSVSCLDRRYVLLPCFGSHDRLHSK